MVLVEFWEIYDVSAPPHTENQEEDVLGLFSKGDALLGPDQVGYV